MTSFKLLPSSDVSTSTDPMLIT